LIRHRDIDENADPVLDSVLGKTKVWGLKMDTEGSETEVLKGAFRWRLAQDQGSQQLKRIKGTFC
jgi:hypothetical protein